MLAVINKHTDIVKYLLFEANADTNIARYDVRLTPFLHVPRVHEPPEEGSW